MNVSLINLIEISQLEIGTAWRSHMILFATARSHGLKSDKK